MEVVATPTLTEARFENCRLGNRWAPLSRGVCVVLPFFLEAYLHVPTGVTHGAHMLFCLVDGFALRSGMLIGFTPYLDELYSYAEAYNSTA